LNLFGSIQHLHFMGAGGVGMCGLAEVMIGHGLTVSGCDLNTSERTERLSRLGARLWLGHDASHLSGTDALVVSAAVADSHPELVAARNAGLPVMSRAELLAELFRRRQGVAVAGTHGKTTTSAMIAYLLTQAGLDPTAVIGGRVCFFDSHARFGSGSVMVCEADEFDRSFLHLAPVWSVITNIEPEHLECYGSVSALEQAFVDFADHTAFYGAVIACSDDPTVARLLPQMKRRVVTYGLSSPAWLRGEITGSEPGRTDVLVRAGKQNLGEMTLPTAGRHNVLNALAAVAVARELQVGFEQLSAHLVDFSGVGRRFEIVGERDEVTVVDDYAHHPTEVRATIAAARQRFPDRRLVAVFQPHLYSRTRDLADQFGEALGAADVVVMLPIYAARESPLEGVNAQLVSRAIHRSQGTQVLEAGDFAEALELLNELLQAGDLLLTMGAGDVHLLAEQWLRGEP
jgi:UDP-N-acetylmuramate--alanine ligase